MGVSRSKLFQTERFEGEEKMREFESKLEMLYRSKHTKLTDELLMLNDKKGLLEGELQELESKMPKLKINASRDFLNAIESNKIKAIKQNAPVICKPTAPVKVDQFVPSVDVKAKKVDLTDKPKAEPFIPKNPNSANKTNKEDNQANESGKDQQTKWSTSGFKKFEPNKEQYQTNTASKAEEEVWD